MTLPISNSSAGGENRVTETRVAETRAEGTPSPDRALSTADTSTSGDVSSLSAVAGQSLESNAAKTETLRLQFQQGTYQVDSVAVSQKLLDLQFPPKD